MYISDMNVGDQIEGFFLLQDAYSKTTMAGKPFLSMVLSDCTGTMDAQAWDYTGPVMPKNVGDVVKIRGTVSEFKGTLQITVDRLLDMKFAYRNSQNKLFPTERADKSDWARLIEFDKNGYCCSQMKITPLGRLWLFVKLKKQFALPYTISECLAIENIERLKISAE